MKTRTRIFLFFVAAALVFGEQPGGAPDEAVIQNGQAAAASAEQPQSQPPAAEADSNAPAEKLVSGNVDFGNRFLGKVAGDFNTYRSVVNLGEGPRLLNLDLRFLPHGEKLFSEMRVQAGSWGGDPYNTLRIDVLKRGIYRFQADYANIQYFNFLPSFANPQLQQGILINQRSFDAQYRNSNILLELMPGKRIVPYVAYGRSSGSGTGITPIVYDNNEYPIGNLLGWRIDDYRGGVRLEFDRWHVSLEQGGTAFKDDQSTYFLGPNYGNRTNPFLGQRLFLTGAAQAYRVRGRSMYSMVNASASPLEWMTLTGQFLFSQPKTEVQFQEVAGGNLALNNPLLFYTSLAGTASGTAKMPHPSGNVTLELRPHRRIRLLESFLTDRFRNATVGIANTVLNPGSIATSASLTDLLEFRYNRQQFDVLFEPARFLVLRGGHRYEWGESTVRAPSYSNPQVLENAQLERHVALAGLTLRLRPHVNVHADYERSESDRYYFRTSLYDYHRLRVQGRWQAFPSLLVALGVRFNQNENPAAGISLDQQYRAYTATVHWMPDKGNRIAVLGEYTNSYFRSDLSYLSGPFYRTEFSRYRDNAHSGTGLLALNLVKLPVGSPRIEMGGSMFVSSGSRPMEYYQPLARLWMPLHRSMTAFGEWRWYRMNQAFYLYEAFRNHQYVVGFRWTL